MDCDYNLIDWVEKEAKENIRHRLHIAELLAKAAEYTLMVLFIGLGGSMSYVLQHISKLDQWDVVGAVVLVLWLMVLGGMLVVHCIMSRDLPVPTNCPKHLFQPEYKLDALRKVELENAQKNIDDVKNRNRYIAGWLNRIRLLAVASPVGKYSSSPFIRLTGTSELF